MKDLDAIREDVEVEMAKELSSCRGDVYAENEALWFALRDERVTKHCIFGDTTITESAGTVSTETAIQNALIEIKDRYWEGTGTQWEDKDCLVLSAILLRNFPL